MVRFPLQKEQEELVRLEIMLSEKLVLAPAKRLEVMAGNHNSAGLENFSKAVNRKFDQPLNGTDHQ